MTYDVIKEEPEKQSEQVSDMGSVTTHSPSGTIHCLTIIGQVEGHQILTDNTKTTKYEHVIPMLTAVEESEEIEGLLVILNTVGGDIEAGLAIAELIAGMKKSTVSLVLGGGHSIGVPLAVSTKKTFIAPSASMTIHPVRMNGMVIGVWQSFEYMKKVQDRIVKFVAGHSNISEEQFEELMLETELLSADIGTIVDGEMAKNYGLCDEVGSLGDALACLHGMIESAKKEEDVSLTND